jgi:ribose transport system permease protein
VIPRRAAAWLADRPWVWAYAGALLIWFLTIAVVRGRGAGETLAVATQFATFYVIVGIGQMFVIASGPGNIDLSIPAVMTLAGYLASGAMNGDDGRAAVGLAVGVGVGLAAGLANVGLIQLLRIPPMIATLAAGFVIQSMAIAYSGISTAKPAPLLTAFAEARVFGVPFIVVCFLGVTVFVAFLLDRSVFGRSVLAIGQNVRAATLAGLGTRATLAVVYVLSAALAGLAGVLLAAYSGGASLDMAADYLLMSIAVVVIGGTSIAGGQVAVPGLWGAAVLLYLIVTMLNVLQVGSGLRYVLTGLIIIAVLAVARPSRAT